MSYTPENNPYIPGDPYSYDLKWMVKDIKHMEERFGELDSQVQEATDQADRSRDEADRSDAEALKSEGFAVGEQDGAAVDPDSPYYENNAKFYAEKAQLDGHAEALRSEGFAIGEQDGTPVGSGSPYYENNSKYFAQEAAASEQAAADYAAHIADPVSGLVADWLADHITQPTTPAIDSSLMVAGAAADAKAAGDAIRITQEAIYKSDDIQFIAWDSSNLNETAAIILETGKTYKFYNFTPYASGTSNFYIESSVGAYDLIGTFNSTTHSFDYVCDADHTVLYIQNFLLSGEQKLYAIGNPTTYEKDGTIYTKINMYNSTTTEFPVDLKAGHSYHLMLESPAPSTFNIYTDPATPPSSLIGTFTATSNKIIFKPTVDITALYGQVYVPAARIIFSMQITVDEETISPKPVILDTDFGGDIDDFSAVAFLMWAERNRNVDVIGINCSVPRMGTYEGQSWELIPAIDAVCNYYGAPDICFGLDNSYTPAEGSNYCGTAAKYKHTLLNNYTGALNSVPFYRKAMVSLPEGVKCDVCIVGYLTAFSDFLNSPADSISSKTGLQLATEKIDTLWIVGGQFPNGKVETNLAGGDGLGNAKPRMVNATSNIFTNFPGRIVMIGAENDPHVGDVLYDENMTWLMSYQCMNQFMVASFNNGQNPWGYTTLEETWHGKSYSWDALAVLAMSDANLSVTGFDTVQGICSIVDDQTDPNYGKNIFTPDATGRHYYVTKQALRNSTWFTKRNDSIIKEEAWPSRTNIRYRLSR